MNLHTHTRLRHNMGYVTRSQFRQCLSYLGLGASEEERRVVEMRFSDSKGFNYLQFLEELQPSEKLEDKYHLRMTQLTAMKQQVSVCIFWGLREGTEQM